ncbi:VWA domain-containing protein [Paenibacillus tarimensis]
MGGRLKRWGLLLAVLALLVSGCSNSERNDAAGNRAGSNTSSQSANTFESANTSKDDRAAAPAEGGERETSEPAGGQSGPEPRPGQLTAGEWNDTLNWSDWENLLNGQDGYGYQERWGFFNFRRLVVEVSSKDGPVADAIVIVKDKSGQFVWESRTDLLGRAFAYAELFDDQRERRESVYSVEVQVGQDIVKQYENVPISRQEVLKINVDGKSDLPDTADIMFVVDTTGSMKDELQYLASELKDVVRRVDQESGQRLKLRLSANFYRDHYDDYVVRPFPFTGDVEQAVKQIAAQTAEGGGDYPEAVDEALTDALHEHEWSREARARLLFLVLDAPPHDDSRSLARMRDLTKDAARMGVRIIPVVSSGTNIDTQYLMRFMAAATGGTYLFLTDHSGIGNDHIEPDVGEYEVQYLNDLLTGVILRYTHPQ